MPTYQYACTACSNQIEATQSFTDDPLTVCPECAGRLRKVFSAVGVVFKGSGFYRNDSRANNGKKDQDGAEKPAAEKADTSAGADSGSGSGDSGKASSSDSKPASNTSTSSSAGNAKSGISASPSTSKDSKGA